MDPIFKAIFPLVLVLFVVSDWPMLRQHSKGVKFGYFCVTAAAAALFGVKAAGYDPTMLERLLILHVSPARAGDDRFTITSGGEQLPCPRKNR